MHDYERGQESFLTKHANVSFVKQTNYINNKWLDVVDRIKIKKNIIHNHQAVLLCDKQQCFEPYVCTPHTRAAHKETNDVKYFDMTYNYENKSMNDENPTITTSEMIVIMKKWFWCND